MADCRAGRKGRQEEGCEGGGGAAHRGHSQKGDDKVLRPPRMAARRRKGEWRGAPHRGNGQKGDEEVLRPRGEVEQRQVRVWDAPKEARRARRIEIGERALRAARPVSAAAAAERLRQRRRELGACLLLRIVMHKRDQRRQQ